MFDSVMRLGMLDIRRSSMGAVIIGGSLMDSLAGSLSLTISLTDSLEGTLICSLM